MANHPNRSAYATARRHILAAGYSADAAAAGLAWAKAQGATGAREAFIVAMSRILYSDDQLADGARFPAEAGHGPR